MGLCDQRVQFCLRELRYVHVISGRKNTARSARLNDVRSIFNVEAHGKTSLLRRVDDSILRTSFVIEKAETETGSFVTMAAGRTEGVHRHEHARTGNDARIDRITKSDVEEVL